MLCPGLPLGWVCPLGLWLCPGLPQLGTLTSLSFSHAAETRRGDPGAAGGEGEGAAGRGRHCHRGGRGQRAEGELTLPQPALEQGGVQDCDAGTMMLLQPSPRAGCAPLSGPAVTAGGVSVCLPADQPPQPGPGRGSGRSHQPQRVQCHEHAAAALPCPPALHLRGAQPGGHRHPHRARQRSREGERRDMEQRDVPLGSGHQPSWGQWRRAPGAAGPAGGTVGPSQCGDSRDRGCSGDIWDRGCSGDIQDYGCSGTFGTGDAQGTFGTRVALRTVGTRDSLGIFGTGNTLGMFGTWDAVGRLEIREHLGGGCSEDTDGQECSAGAWSWGCGCSEDSLSGGSAPWGEIITLSVNIRIFSTRSLFGLSSITLPARRSPGGSGTTFPRTSARWHTEPTGTC